MFRLNIRTGTNVLDGLMPPPLAYTSAGWLTDRQPSFHVYPLPPLVLRRHQAVRAGDDTTAVPSTDIMPGAGAREMVADETAAVQSYVTSTGTSDSWNVDLVDLVNKAKQTLVTASPDPVTSLALSSTTVAWSSKAANGPLVISRRARSGGPITSFTEDNPNADAEHLAAGNGDVAYLVTDPTRTLMRLVTAGTTRSVEVPSGSSGIAAVGNRYLTAVGGPSAVAGVYSVEGTTVTRTATVPTRHHRLASVAVTASQLYYTDGSVTGLPGTSLWQRTITGRNRPSLGPEAAVSTRPADLAGLRESSAISFSAGRGAIAAATDGSWHLLDRGTETGAIPRSNDVKVSGPYTLTSGKIYDTEGNLLHTIPTADGQVVAQDIFGSTVVYALKPDNSSGAALWWDDVNQPGPRRLGDVPADTPCGGAPSFLAIWGETVVWDTCDGEPLTRVNLTTGYRETILSTRTTDRFRRYTLAENTLAWPDGTNTSVLDLTSADLLPITLVGASESVLLDDHRLVRHRIDERGRSLGHDLQRVPFTAKNQPRLLGVAAPRGFTPDGDGRADTWKPQFDITKPLRKAELTISALSTGKVLRTLPGTAPDGSIRDLTWDGEDKKGSTVPIGTYRWTLTGKADDGDGTLIGPLGQSTVEGTIEINAVS